MSSGERIPPNDLNAEAQVLSALLCAHASVAEAQGYDTGLDTARCLLRSEHWYSDANRCVFEAVMALESESKAVDSASVAAWLNDRDILNRAGGESYLRQLVEDTPATVHVDDCARRIRDKWRVRQLISSCQRIAAEGYGIVEDASAFVDGAERAICEISVEREARQPEPIGDVIRERFRSLQERTQRGTAEMVRTGIADLDRVIVGLQAPDLVTVAARPGLGKTAFALNNLAMRTAERGIGVGVFSLEMGREQLVDRAICSGALVDSRKIPAGTLSADEWTRLTAEAARVSKLPIIIDDEGAITLQAIRAKTRRMASELRRKGTPLGLVVVDYLQLMGTPRGRETRDEKVGGNSRGLKALAKDLGLVVVQLAQLNRDVEKRGKNARPQLSYLRESGAIEQDSDVVLFLHHGKESAEVIVAKHRHFGTGVARVAWRPVYTRFDGFEPGTTTSNDPDEREW